MNAETKKLSADFSSLCLSIASSAMMAMGFDESTEGQKQTTEKNYEIAQFNIELLDMLKTKTKGNLTSDEERFLEALIHDLKRNFVELRKTNGGKN